VLTSHPTVQQRQLQTGKLTADTSWNSYTGWYKNCATDNYESKKAATYSVLTWPLIKTLSL